MPHLVCNSAPKGDGAAVSVQGTGDIQDVHNSTPAPIKRITIMRSSMASIGNTSSGMNNEALARTPQSEEGGRRVDLRRDSQDIGGGRTGDAGSAGRTNVLLVHRLPIDTLPEHVSEMFLEYASIRPKSVKKISYLGPLGKCYVEFMTSRHAEMAYDSLVGEERPDSYGNVQKTVVLKGGGTIICLRKMKKFK